MAYLQYVSGITRMRLIYTLYHRKVYLPLQAPITVVDVEEAVNVALHNINHKIDIHRLDTRFNVYTALLYVG